jgi:hypothetical protein
MENPIIFSFPGNTALVTVLADKLAQIEQKLIRIIIITY